MGPVFGFDGDVVAGIHRAANDTGFNCIVDLVKGHNACTRNVDRDSTGTAGGNTHGNAEGLDIQGVGGSCVIGGGRHGNRTGRIH